MTPTSPLQTDRLAQLEAELSRVRHSLEQRDTELDALRNKVQEATAESREAQIEAEQWSQALEKRFTKVAENSLLRAKLMKLKAYKEAREKHKQMMERERSLMDDWMQDVKERFIV